MPAALGGRQTLANAVDTAHASALECFWVSVRKKNTLSLRYKEPEWRPHT